MSLTRRRLIGTASAALAAGALAPRGWAATTLEAGGVRLDTLSDGHLVLPLDFALGDTPPEQAAPILEAHGIAGELTPPCNLTLLRDGENTVLFDAGSGPGFMPTAGRLPEALEVLGIAPEEVTHLVITHGHPDHIWGLLDDFEDPLFPEARHLIGAAERDYWMDPATVDSIGAARQSFAVGAQRRLEAVADLTGVFGDGETLLPGVTAVATPGHTPGHMSFRLDLGGTPVLVVGDAIVNHHLAFARPEWLSGSDQDPALAAETRSALLARLVQENLPLVGFHLPEGGLGRAEKAETGYRYVPAV
jgi:glyoxylase-like metal-dependent hydrolase (beta-lactamase superfamily II)